MAGALRAIQFAREHDVPFLGTCGGFQHALIEYARNVLGVSEADHEETRPDGACVLISRLACPLVEQTGSISIEANSRLRQIYAVHGGSALQILTGMGMTISRPAILMEKSTLAGAEAMARSKDRREFPVARPTCAPLLPAISITMDVRTLRRPPLTMAS